MTTKTTWWFHRNVKAAHFSISAKFLVKAMEKIWKPSFRWARKNSATFQPHFTEARHWCKAAGLIHHHCCSWCHWLVKTGQRGALVWVTIRQKFELYCPPTWRPGRLQEGTRTQMRTDNDSNSPLGHFLGTLSDTFWEVRMNCRGQSFDICWNSRGWCQGEVFFKIWEVRSGQVRRKIKQKNRGWQALADMNINMKKY